MVTEIVNGLASDWPITLGFVVLGVLFIQLFLMVLRLKYQLKGSQKQVETVVKELALLSSGTVGMGQRMVKLQKKFDELSNKQGEQTESEAQFAYSQALRLLEQGVDESTIAANSGLSKSEIQLMQLVQGQKDTA